MSTLSGNPHHAQAEAQKADYVIPPSDDPSYPVVSALTEIAERHAALAFEVRTVALLLASTMAGTADSADDQYDEAMRRMGEGETDDQ